MPNSIKIPYLYLGLFGIPLGLVLITLMIRSLLEGNGKSVKKRDAKQETINSLIWVIPPVLLGLVIWFFLRPVLEGHELEIFFYGILIMIGVIAATFLALSEAKRRGMNPEVIWDALFWVVLAGIIGARLWHIFTPQADMLVLDASTGKMVNPYFAGGYPHILDILNLRNGGLGIPGAVIGGAIALWIYCRKRKISFLAWTDAIIPGVALAQAIGRWGNFFNQELYGAPTTLPWGISIAAGKRIGEYTDMGTYPAATGFHPLFLYESIWNLINMTLLLWIARRFEKWLKGGDILYLYMILYSVGRFCLDYLRVGTISFNHYFIAIVALAGGVLFFLNHRPQRVKAK